MTKRRKNKATKQAKKPEILYKYTAIKYIEAILTNSSLKITNPLEFNDPFDCNIPSINTKTIDQFKKLFRDEISKALTLDPKSQEFNIAMASLEGNFNSIKNDILNDFQTLRDHWSECKLPQK